MSAYGSPSTPNARGASAPSSTGPAHTPGPWKACWSVERDFYGVYPDTGRSEFPIAKMPEIIKAELNVANARMIAAAPDLLYALSGLLKYGTAFPGFMADHPRIAAAFAALAKADASCAGPLSDGDTSSSTTEPDAVPGTTP